MDTKQSLVVFIFFLAAISAIGFFLYHPNDKVAVVSQLDLNPTPQEKHATSVKTQDPVVISWKTYSNDQYNFTLTVPADWHQEDYSPYYQNKGTLIAFSPHPLPCSSCSYFHNGFISVRIYNQKTDPDLYTNFQTRVKNIGQVQGFQKAQLGGVPGVLYANSVAVENHGWVYEVSLDKDNGQDNALDSDLFQKIASSLTFTYLIFTK